MREHQSEQVIRGDEWPERSWSLVGVVVVLGFLLVAIVGLSSSSAPWLPGDGGGSSAPAYVGNILAVALAIGLCALLVLLWVVTPEQSKAKPPSAAAPAADEEVKAALWAGTLVLIGALVATVLLILAFWYLLEHATSAGSPAPPPIASGDGAVTTARPAPGSAASPVFHWFALALGAAAALLVPLGILVRHRRRNVDVADSHEELAELVVGVVGSSIEEIERESDSRRAIIRAYARMEGAFDEAGFPRRPHEAPFEYVGRALRGLRVGPSAVGRLATLFEAARFGQHHAGAETKDEALGALREIDRQLQEPSE